jgi:hypothetical protein
MREFDRRDFAATRWRHLAGLIGVAALAATAACTDSGGGSDEAGDPEGGTAVDAAGLLEMANENVRLSKELDAAEDRVIAECLEEQGFDVHDLRELGQHEPYEVTSLVDYYPTQGFLPEAAIAAEWGFGWWTETEEMFESEETQDYYDATFPDTFDDEPVFDNSAFESLPDDERRAWRVAYQGEEATAALEGTGEPTGGDESSEDGSLEFGDGEMPSGPKPGGCQLEMIEALYGEPKQVELEVEGGYLTWVWQPEQPAVDYEAMEAEYASRMSGEHGGFLDCITEAGHPGWEFDDTGRLVMRDYSSMLYTGEPFEEFVPGEEVPADTSPPVPDLPADVPSDFDGKLAYEVEMAVDFARCGDETGYRQTATSTYDAVVAEQYAAIEVDTYAWQDQIRDYIVKAQDLIAG